MFVGTQSKSIACFEVETLSMQWQIAIDHSPRCFAFQRDTSLLYAGLEADIIKVNTRDPSLGALQLHAEPHEHNTKVKQCMSLSVTRGSDGVQRLLVYDRVMAFQAIVLEAASLHRKQDYVTEDPLHWMTCQMHKVHTHGLVFTAPFQEEELHIFSVDTMKKVVVIRTGAKGSGDVVCKLVSGPFDGDGGDPRSQAEPPLFIIIGRSLAGPEDEHVRMKGQAYMLDVAKIKAWLQGEVKQAASLPINVDFHKVSETWLCKGCAPVDLPEISYANDCLLDVPTCRATGVDAWEAPSILGDQIIVSDADGGCLLFTRERGTGGGAVLAQAAIRDGSISWEIPMDERARCWTSVAPDALLAVSDGVSTITCWDSATGSERWSRKMQRRVIAVRVHAASLLVMCDDGSLAKLAAATGDINFHTRLRKPVAHSSAILFAAGQFVLSGATREALNEEDTGLSLTAWLLDTGRFVNRKTVTSKISSMCQGSNPHTMFTGHADGSITMWEVSVDNLKHCWQTKVQTHGVLAMCNAGSYLVAMSAFRVVAVHRWSMEALHVSCTMALGEPWLQQVQDILLPGWYCFLKKLASILVTFVQLLSFAMITNGKSHFSDRFQRTVNFVASLGLSIEVNHDFKIAFYMACGGIVIFMMLTRYKERAEWHTFLKPKHTMTRLFTLFVFGCCTCFAGSAFLPLSQILFLVVQCSSSVDAGETLYFLTHDTSIECWTAQHVCSMVLVSSLLYLPFVLLVFRIVRADFTLPLLEVRWNPFDCSGDTAASVHNRPLAHRLMPRSNFYAQLVVLTKLALSFVNVVMSTDYLVSDPAQRDIIVNAVQIVFAVALVVTNFTNEQFWDFHIFGLTPNAIQASFDTGILWTYVRMLYLDLNGGTESTSSVLLGIAFSVSMGYLVRRVWEFRSGRQQPEGFHDEDEMMCAAGKVSSRVVPDAEPLLQEVRLDVSGANMGG